MDKVILVGRLANDPDVSYTQSGKAKATFRLAVTPYRGAKDTSFIPIVVWDKVAENVGNFLAKGRQIALEGYLQTRNYETDNGKKWVIEVIAKDIEFLGGKKTENSVSQSDANAAFPDEEIPF